MSFYEDRIILILCRARHAQPPEPYTVVWYELAGIPRRPDEVNVYGLCLNWEGMFPNLQFITAETDDCVLDDEDVESEPDNDAFWTS